MAVIVLTAIAVIGGVLALSSAAGPSTRVVRGWLDECGLSGVPTGTIVAVLGVLALVAAGIVAALVPVPVMAPVAAVAGVAIPLAALDGARTRRRASAEQCWPDVLDAIRMAVRAGAALDDALTAASSHVPRDWAEDWKRVIVDISRGGSVATALLSFRASRAESIADRVVEALILAHELGGTELPHILDDLARSVRDELRIRRDGTSRQSWVRHTARLAALAPWVVVFLLASRPENREAFSSASGTALLVGCAGATLVAYLMMSALGRLPTPPRWVTDG